MLSSRHRYLAVAAMIVIGIALYALWTVPVAPSQVGLRSADPRAGSLPLSFPAPAFELPDQDGQPISTQNLRGKVTIVDFIFTNCGNTCPKMTAKRSELQKLLPDPRINFLSISVDPARDDKTTRKTYAKENNLDESRWRFVSPASEEAALSLAREMKIASAGPHSHEHSPILHSDRFVLIDSNAKVRGAYAITDTGAMDRLLRDASTLASEIPPTTR